MNEPWFYAVWAMGAYLLGSVPFGVLVAREANVDIHNEGTRNPGTANIYREIGLGSAVVVFLLDLIKGAAAVVPIYLFDLPQQEGLAAAGAVLTGHFFPVFWQFKGGTGLVVGMGASLGFLPLGALIAVPFTAAFAKLSKDMGQAGGVFIVTATIAGALVHRDLFSVVAVLLIGLAIGVKSWMQYDHWQR